MNIVLIGYGNVGKEIEKILKEKNLSVDFIIRSNGIYNTLGSKVDEKENFNKYIDAQSVIFISVPSSEDGADASKYYESSLILGAKIITCEKAFIAHNWEIVQKYKEKIRYSATVAGNSGILEAITEHQGNIKEIKAVINGTLNYIGEGLSRNKTKEELFKEVVQKGFAEPGAHHFYEAVERELNDVTYKAVIIANHSNFFKNFIKPKDISVMKYKDGLRCSVVIDLQNIRAGYIPQDDTTWFPKGVNNVLYINGYKVVEGAGAGGRATAERMFKDYKSLLS